MASGGLERKERERECIRLEVSKSLFIPLIHIFYFISKLKLLLNKPINIQ